MAKKTPKSEPDAAKAEVTATPPAVEVTHAPTEGRSQDASAPTAGAEDTKVTPSEADAAAAGDAGSAAEPDGAADAAAEATSEAVTEDAPAFITFDQFALLRGLTPFQKGHAKAVLGTRERPLAQWLEAHARNFGG